MRPADQAMPPDRAMLDTNVLLAATDEGRAEHAQALAVVNDWPAGGTTLYASGQIMREYLAVATRPADKNGLGLALAEALANVQAFRGRTTLLAEDSKVADRLLALATDCACGGKQIHDANIVATMLVHGIGTIVTINTGDFTRFWRHVRLVGLAALEADDGAH
jgi:predicted nucleic acid-binding protein